jgi:hypothetical protein
MTVHSRRPLLAVSCVMASNGRADYQLVTDVTDGVNFWLAMALFGTAYFQLLHKFKQKFCQTVSFCSSLLVQLLLRIH